MSPLKREFIQLFEASGYSQADVGRLLELTRSAVNQIITGDNIPSPATVKLFKLILASEKPEVLKAKDRHMLSEEPARLNLDELGTDLLMLPAEQREAMIRALRQVVQASLPRTKYGEKNS